MDIKKFLEKFNQNYDFLYENGENVSGYHDALKYGESALNSRPEFVRQFCAALGDFICSDTEVAAFGFTLADFGL